MINVPNSIRYVFFDVDGVLSAPCYYDDKKMAYVIGFSDEGWNEYLNNEGIYTYKYCKPVDFVKDFIVQLKEKNIKTYVLSTVANRTEAKAKSLFLDNNYKDLFIDYYYVEHDSEKLKFLLDFVKRKEILLQECLLVDDTYSILLDCHNEGISATHISNLLADNITK